MKGNHQSLKGKKIAASFGTINHLYILTILEKAGLTPNDVTLVNTPPPDMTVALLAKGIDAFSCWDPWPIVAPKDVPGAWEVPCGADVISYLGFNVGLRPWGVGRDPGGQDEVFPAACTLDSAQGDWPDEGGQDRGRRV